MELSDYIRILRKNWLMIVVATLVGVGVAAVFSLTRTPLYEASSTVAVSTQTGGSVAEVQQGSSFAQTRINTYVGLVRTPIVLNPAIAKLGLGVTADEMAEVVTATSALNTTLITITVTDSDPVAAADAANTIAASLAAVVPEIEPDIEGASPVRLTRVSDALPPLTPSSPNVPLNLALGALLGLALGIGIAVLRSVLDTRVRSPRDVAQVTDVPLIGAIAFDAKAKERPLIVHADPLSPRAESFRSLRTNLQFLDMGGRSSFVVTSSVPSEGKSTSAINLAIAVADAGKRVALLDTDLRKPKVAEYLGIEGGAGLTDVLIGRVRVGEVMLPWGGRSLYVLPAGKIPPNPSELLGSEQMQTLLEVLERDFDVVLCDAPPLLPVTDAAILAKSTSGAIVVVSTGSTNRHQLEAAIETLVTVGARVAGVVMTKVPTRGPDSYYSQYGAYGYGYGYREPASKKSRGRRRKNVVSDVPPPAPVLPDAGPSLPSTARTTFARPAGGVDAVHPMTAPATGATPISATPSGAVRTVDALGALGAHGSDAVPSPSAAVHAVDAPASPAGAVRDADAVPSPSAAVRTSDAVSSPSAAVRTSGAVASPSASPQAAPPSAARAAATRTADSPSPAGNAAGAQAAHPVATSPHVMRTADSTHSPAPGVSAAPGASPAPGVSATPGVSAAPGVAAAPSAGVPPTSPAASAPARAWPSTSPGSAGGATARPTTGSVAPRPGAASAAPTATASAVSSTPASGAPTASASAGPATQTPTPAPTPAPASARAAAAVPSTARTAAQPRPADVATTPPAAAPRAQVVSTPAPVEGSRAATQRQSEFDALLSGEPLSDDVSARKRP